MTNGEMRKEIARIAMPQWLCGCGLHWRQSDNVSCGNPVPDYPNDLNAMHEAWRSLTKAEHKAFREWLQEIVWRDGYTQANPHRSVSNATAAQRAEAFLRAKGGQLPA